MKTHNGGGTVLEEGIALLCRRDGDIQDLLGGSNTDRAFSLLNKYIEVIERFNPSLSLVSATERRELVIRHILDSLAPLGVLRRLVRLTSLQVADVGSGAGLPGIPLAIALPDCFFTLIERKTRRAEFLRNTLSVLGLPNAVVEEREMEKALRFRFGIITFRAFRPLEPAILKKLFRLLVPGGALAAYKGRQEKIAAEMRSAGDLASSWEVISCPVPFLDEERHMVIIRPIGSL
ncbi:MAG: 16S rRNA (guanine(527)-N(7))-methyltransferase RsmG [Treponema sp.]|nr:16S rRNA (guanine(527)-N(7))-methyltransferase RsmG [Treponema sp.]